MDTKRTLVLAVAALGVGALGCEETTRPAPPPPPPQASFEVYNSRATDSKFRIEDDEVYDVYVDSQDRVWFSHDQGVSMKDGSNDIVTFDPFDGIPSRLCRAVTEHQGKMYVGTWGGGAAVWEDTVWVPLPIDNVRPQASQLGDSGLVDTRVAAMVSDGTFLWIGTINGLSRYNATPGLTNTQAWSNHTSKMGFSRVTTRMHYQPGTSRGDEIWISTKDGGITVVRNGVSSERFIAGNTGLDENDCNGVAYSPNNDLFWIAMATKGFSSVDVGAKVWTGLSTVDGLASNLGTGVAVRDAGGTEELWMATQNGLSLMIGSAINNYIKGSGLPSERVRCVVADRNGEIWACFIGEGAGRLLTYELRNK